MAIVKNLWRSINKGMLDNLYIEERKSSREIAKIFKCSHSAILYHLKKHNILRRYKGEGKKGKKLTSEQKKRYQKYWKSLTGNPPGNVKEKIIKYCLKCGKEFKVPPSLNHINHCSISCGKLGQKAWNKGKHILLISGSNHWNWKGGITPLHLEIRQALEYLQWRNKIFERDNYTCQDCNARNGNGTQIILNAHHIRSFSEIIKENNIKSMEDAIKCKELWDINNGITYCIDCHYEESYEH